MADNAGPATGSGEPGIVAGADGSEISYHAVAWAAVEADLRHCPLHIISSYMITVGVANPKLSMEDLHALRDQGKRVLAEAERTARLALPGDTVPITTELIVDPIAPALIERSRRARMVVVGSRGLGSIRRAVLGSVSTALSRHAHCPVAIVHGRYATTELGKPIVVGLDGTPNSVPAIAQAFEEAALRKAELIAVHAWNDTIGVELPAVGWEPVLQDEDGLLWAALAGYRERHPAVTVERVAARDTPVRALLDAARDAQLIVVGSHGRSGFTSMVLGSVSTQLLHAAECPVLVVRESSHSPADEPARQ